MILKWHNDQMTQTVIASRSLRFKSTQLSRRPAGQPDCRAEIQTNGPTPCDEFYVFFIHQWIRDIPPIIIGNTLWCPCVSPSEMGWGVLLGIDLVIHMSVNSKWTFEVVGDRKGFKFKSYIDKMHFHPMGVLWYVSQSPYNLQAIFVFCLSQSFHETNHL